MSYSFNVVAATKEEAKTKAAEQFDAVINGQPIHSNDKEAALNAAGAVIDLLADPKGAHPTKGGGQDVALSVSGYLSWQGENHFVGANVSVSASLRDKQ